MRWASSINLFLIVTPWSWLTPELALAQNRDPTVQVGAQIAGITFLDNSGHPNISAGLATSTVFRTASRLAVEFDASWFPSNWPATYETQGGRALLVKAGLRATFLSWRRVSVAGTLLPGVLSLARTFRGVDVGPGTHFVLGLGGGVSFRLSKRTVARADGTLNLYPVRGQPAGPQGVPPEEAATIASTWELGAGIGYGVGQLHETTASEASLGQLTVGGDASYDLATTAFPTTASVRQAGVGGFVSYPLLAYCDADATFGIFPGVSKAFTPFEGGRMLQGLVGVKVGRRARRVGVFAKVRGGLATYTRALIAVNDMVPTEAWSSHVALDLGGVLEFYVHSRFVLRLDAGDTHLFYRDTTVSVNGVSLPQPVPTATNSIATTVGFGWRY